MSGRHIHAVNLRKKYIKTCFQITIWIIFQGDGEMIVCMDANFGLVRKKSSGKSTVEPLQGNIMFAKDADVQQYLHSCPDSSKPNEVRNVLKL